MTLDEIYNRMNEIQTDESLSEEEMNAKIEELLDTYSNKITVHCPTLDDHLRPKPEAINLPDGYKCINHHDCASCPRFIGYKTGSGGEVFAYMSLEGRCLKEEYGQKEKEEG